MADSSSSGLRLTAPSHQMYETGAGEQALLGRMTPEALPALFPFLLQQQQATQQNTEAYNDQLSRVNAQQGRLAQNKLDLDELINLRGTGVELGKLGADLSNIRALNGMFNNRELTAQTDSNRRELMLADALAKRGSGLANMSQAGYQLVPGQSGTGTGQGNLDGMRFQTTRPEAIEKEIINSNGQITAAGIRAASEGGNAGVKYEYSGMPNAPAAATLTARGPNRQAVIDGWRDLAGQARGAPVPGAPPPAGGGGGGGSPTVAPDPVIQRAMAMNGGKPAPVLYNHQSGKWMVTLPGRSPVEVR